MERDITIDGVNDYHFNINSLDWHDRYLYEAVDEIIGKTGKQALKILSKHQNRLENRAKRLHMEEPDYEFESCDSTIEHFNMLINASNRHPKKRWAVRFH
jgi:DNA integrity scanning protein DisA with diadenylate cyclase activity